ncbi:hypothetical protein [Sorangium sp. So ce1097]|uniref:hypothetical protein n=1 Tax=Sorangium sp. So ce1097 TaxID=3133330 RepID=UPI003F644077
MSPARAPRGNTAPQRASGRSRRTIARGTLVQVLAPFRGASRPFSLIHPRGTVLSPAARALKAFVIEREAARAR